MNVETPLDEALHAMTEALLGPSGETGMHRSARAHDPDLVEPFIPILLALRSMFTPVEPSHKFVRDLRADLLGTPDRSVVARVRAMPPRVQWAAGVFAVVGAVWIVLRWLTGIASSRAERDLEATSQEA
ncbi:MAG: hypothetical protein IT298_16745 [Chloroflexi bacterium]|jgi:hypothetical protein|nr:MAG: hypothetical protein UZ13_02164 [Chloroflexi bacterium OLB13]MBC6954696.1 hypothetical protein [Chloroflexota bacterium]MBV6436313.1 hypothetical protein [Anaerolineae bacterium]MDL1914814.1 hypothetical protein [Anaerolineae bacterium CFX4]OQY84871.1 MAG: hypothetical protein B6D42_04425 [Anaerolineae bacterium UTCFX5]